MSSGKVLLGVLIGAVAGAAAGLLLAPEKGSETRERIAEMGEDYLELVKDKFDDLYENMSSKIGQLKKDFEAVTEKKKSS
jgi:gas vesicle protein